MAIYASHLTLNSNELPGIESKEIISCCSGEKNEKYRELKLKEAEVDEFLNSYDNLKMEEESRIQETSAEVVHILELISANITSLSTISQNINLNQFELNVNENISAAELKECKITVVNY